MASSDGFQVNPRSKRRPSLKEELNILLLGETGVGKSTWINGFANNMTCSSLEEAENNKIFLIPMKFGLTLDFEPRKLSTGTDNNENTEIGESSTQSPKFYLFQIDETVVRLIDTAGVGDTRGYDHDKKNFRTTLEHVSQLETLHGIIVLLQKPDNARLNVIFKFCIEELLTHVHNSATHNINILLHPLARHSVHFR